MDYKTNIEFLDWLIWNKKVSENEWIKASEESKKSLFKEFKENNQTN